MWALLLEAGFDRIMLKAYRQESPLGHLLGIQLIAYVKAIDSQRETARTSADSVSLTRLLGLSPAEWTPDHSSLTKIRQRIPT